MGVLMDVSFFSRGWRWLMWGVLASLLVGSALAARPRHQDPVSSCPLDARPVSLPMDEVGLLIEACVLAGGESPPGAQEPWQLVSLPHRWRSTHPDYEGTMWYRLRVRLDSPPPAPWAVYLPRAIMNAQVWVNGVSMAQTGSMSAPVTRNWYTPLLTQVHDDAWRVGDNVIDIKVVSGFASRNGLSAVRVGPLAQLEAVYKQRTLVQVETMSFANVTLLALGLFMVIVWSRDRDQRAIGFQGLAALLWGAGITALAAPNPLFVATPWWEIMAYSVMAWGLLLMCQFFWRFVGTRWFWADVLIYSMMVLAPYLAITRPSAQMTATVFGLICVVLFISLAQSIHTVFKRKRRDRGWLLVGCVMLVAGASHDLAFECDLLPMDSLYWLPYVGPLVMACVFYMLAGDYARSRRALNRLNDNLSTTVAHRELELRESFERLSHLERAQAVSAERSRILRDMHDGVGAHLTSALRQLQSPRDAGVDLGLVTQTLRDSLDHLKLSIDALSLPPGDVVGLLASLRFRITPRLKAAGLELIWDVPDLPNWPDGQPPALRQLQYILFEGLSNALQHSGASKLTLSARVFYDRMQVSLIDNGRGWESQGEGQGLQAMRARASVIGAKVDFLPVSDGGLELRVTLPMRHERHVDLSSTA